MEYLYAPSSAQQPTLYQGALPPGAGKQAGFNWASFFACLGIGTTLGFGAAGLTELFEGAETLSDITASDIRDGARELVADSNTAYGINGWTDKTGVDASPALKQVQQELNSYVEVIREKGNLKNFQDWGASTEFLDGNEQVTTITENVMGTDTEFLLVRFENGDVARVNIENILGASNQDIAVLSERGRRIFSTFKEYAQIEQSEGIDFTRGAQIVGTGAALGAGYGIIKSPKATINARDTAALDGKLIADRQMRAGMGV
ncbi:MAG: hypothetical protein F6K62_10175 [Sphaerospermopsis sp. SIO1G2]|nr:hypothetical protein [Sphaerospermopsis sp. SIO1G2]